MPDRMLLRDAIEAVETTASDDPERARGVLARLYATYAQATLTALGIDVDLPAVCGDAGTLRVIRVAAPSR